MAKTTYTGTGNSVVSATEDLYKNCGVSEGGHLEGEILYTVTLKRLKGKPKTGVKSNDYGEALVSALESAKLSTTAYLSNKDKYSLDVLAEATLDTERKGRPSGAAPSTKKQGQLTDLF